MWMVALLTRMFFNSEKCSEHGKNNKKISNKYLQFLSLKNRQKKMLSNELLILTMLV